MVEYVHLYSTHSTKSLPSKTNIAQVDAEITISIETGAAKNFQQNGNPDSLEVTVTANWLLADN